MTYDRKVAEDGCNFLVCVFDDRRPIRKDPEQIFTYCNMNDI